MPLGSIATITEKPAPLVVNHIGQFPAATISFNLANGVSLGDAVKAIETAERELGMPVSIKTGFQGAALAFRSSLSSTLLLILAAIVAVYIVLGVLYESYIHPVTILSTLPSAGVGALLALMMTKTDLGIIGIIGIVLLIGIVKKNAIMMIDFALEAERKEGKTPREAIFQASPAAVPAHSDDHPVGPAERLAADARHRGRLRAAPSPGHHHGGRAHPQPDADTLYHPGHLPGLRSAEPAYQEQFQPFRTG